MGLDDANRIGRAAERLRRRSRTSLKVLVPTAAALGAGAAIAVGQIPGASGTISACYQDVSPGTNGADAPYGTLRIIDPSAASNGDPTWPNNACGTNEAPLSWNQQGQQGGPGPQGPKGSPGPAGSPGPPGTVVSDSSFGYTASKSDRLMLKLDGVEGGVTRKGFKGDIEVSSFSVGTEHAVSASTQGTGAGAGKVDVQSFEFVKKHDRTDSVLLLDTAAGRSIKSAELGVYHGSKNLVQVADYRFSDVKLTSVQNGPNSETVTGTFRKLQASVGTGKSKVSTGWNLITNKAP